MHGQSGAGPRTSFFPFFIEGAQCRLEKRLDGAEKGKRENASVQGHGVHSTSCRCLRDVRCSCNVVDKDWQTPSKTFGNSEPEEDYLFRPFSDFVQISQVCPNRGLGTETFVPRVLCLRHESEPCQVPRD